MEALEVLSRVKIASPCTADWAQMSGDDRVRFCTHCQKHVYNLSAMSAESATALIREKEGKLCARLYRRHDGTVLSTDCPIGAARVWNRCKQWACAGAALLFVAGYAQFAPSVIARSRTSTRTAGASTSSPTQFARDPWSRLKSWLGLSPRSMVVMGDICVPPAIPTGAGNAGGVLGVSVDDGDSDSPSNVTPESQGPRD